MGREHPDIVCHAPAEPHDDNGDGVSDRQEELITSLGFGLDFRGADHTTNGCRLAIDGWIYIAVGDYGAVKATGKDGRSLAMRGGGIVRVRPDGSGMERVVWNTRNILSVAISPTMELFTRDNTNDGGGWPVGSIFLDEPALPKDWAHGFYSVEWGRSEIDLHPLTLRRKDGDAAWHTIAGELVAAPIQFHPADRHLADLAADFKTRFKISLAAAFAAALAKEKKAELVTGDREFKALEREIKINWLK